MSLNDKTQAPRRIRADDLVARHSLDKKLQLIYSDNECYFTLHFQLISLFIKVNFDRIDSSGGMLSRGHSCYQPD